ncbi:MAG: coproporphyrinogen III oxidase-like Fe-S oxidoreductase [Planctomycetota bacterium]|jgi:coproporphyrinogen III oxidase-like Fe-S oxidoreductase
MAIDFKYTISESQYRHWIRLSNEELIPKPLTLLFYFDCSDPDEQYWSDLLQELSLQAALLDSDRKVIKLLVGGCVLENLDRACSRQLLNAIQTHYDLVCLCRFQQQKPLRDYDGCCDVIGHGVAAISQINENLIQNSEDQGHYHQSIAAGVIPVTRAWNRHQEKKFQPA